MLILILINKDLRTFHSVKCIYSQAAVGHTRPWKILIILKQGRKMVTFLQRKMAPHTSPGLPAMMGSLSPFTACDLEPKHSCSWEKPWRPTPVLKTSMWNLLLKQLQGSKSQTRRCPELFYLPIIQKSRKTSLLCTAVIELTDNLSFGMSSSLSSSIVTSSPLSISLDTKWKVYMHTAGQSA